MKQGTYKEL